MPWRHSSQDKGPRALGLMSLEPSNPTLKEHVREALAAPRRAVAYIMVPAVSCMSALALGSDAASEIHYCNAAMNIVMVTVPLLLSLSALTAVWLFNFSAKAADTSAHSGRAALDGGTGRATGSVQQHDTSIASVASSSGAPDASIVTTAATVRGSAASDQRTSAVSGHAVESAATAAAVAATAADAGGEHIYAESGESSGGGSGGCKSREDALPWMLRSHVIVRILYVTQCTLLLAVMYVELTTSEDAESEGSVSVTGGGDAGGAGARASGGDGTTGATAAAVDTAMVLPTLAYHTLAFDTGLVFTFIAAQYLVGLLGTLPLLDIVAVHVAAAPYFYLFASQMVMEWQGSSSGSDGRATDAGAIIVTWWLLQGTMLCLALRGVAAWASELVSARLGAAGGLACADSDSARYNVFMSGEEVRREYVAQTLHDIGTPLATFSLGLDLLFSSPLVVSNDYRDVLETMKTARDMMTLTRKKAMDYFRHQAGIALVPNIASTDVHDLVLEKCRRIMTGYTGASRVPFYFFIDPRVSRFVLTDRDWVWECAINYLSNAQKLTKEGSIHMSVTLVPSPVPGATPLHLRFEVRDTGPGVPDDKKAVLFKPFSQLQKGSGGTGLGLYSVKKKVQVLGGVVGIENNPDGRGSVFYFTFPYQPDAQMDFGYYDDPTLPPVMPPSVSPVGACSFRSAGGAGPDANTGAGVTVCVEAEGEGVTAASAATEGPGAAAHTPAGAGWPLHPGGTFMSPPPVPAAVAATVAAGAAAAVLVAGAANGSSTPGDAIAVPAWRSDGSSPAGSGDGSDPGVRPAHGGAVSGSGHSSDSGEHAQHRRQPSSKGGGCSSGSSSGVLKDMMRSRSASGSGGAPAVHGDADASAATGTLPPHVGDTPPLHEAAALATSPIHMLGAPLRSSGDGGAHNGSAPQVPHLQRNGTAGSLQLDGSGGSSGSDARGHHPPHGTAAAHPGHGRVLSRGESGTIAIGSGASGRAAALPLLVVEDDATMSKFLAVMLRRQGYTVQLASNGVEGLEAMREQHFLAVLTDTHMPVMGGYEQVRHIREWEAAQAAQASEGQAEAAGAAGAAATAAAPPSPRRHFIISMSADAEDSAVDALRWGCDAYLPKPVDMGALTSLLRTLAERGDSAAPPPRLLS